MGDFFLQNEDFGKLNCSILHAEVFHVFECSLDRWLCLHCFIPHCVCNSLCRQSFGRQKINSGKAMYYFKSIRVHTIVPDVVLFKT